MKLKIDKVPWLRIRGLNLASLGAPNMARTPTDFNIERYGSYEWIPDAVSIMKSNELARACKQQKTKQDNHQSNKT